MSMQQSSDLSLIKTDPLVTHNIDLLSSYLTALYTGTHSTNLTVDCPHFGFQNVHDIYTHVQDALPFSFTLH